VSMGGHTSQCRGSRRCRQHSRVAEMSFEVLLTTMPERLRGLKVGEQADVLQDDGNVLSNVLPITHRSKSITRGITISARTYTSRKANCQYQEHVSGYGSLPKDLKSWFDATFMKH